jgi:hypothetical protein
MHGVGFDVPLFKWFEHKVPKTSIAPDYIRNILASADGSTTAPNAKVIYYGPQPSMEYFVKTKKGSSWSMASLRFESRSKTITISVPDTQGKWLHELLQKIHIDQARQWTLQEVKADYAAAGLEHFELFWDNKPINGLNKAGLWVV